MPAKVEPYLKKHFRLIALLTFLPIFIPISAEAFGPNNATCYELGTCEFFEQPFDTMILPYTEVFGSFTYLLLWSVIIGILWLRLGNTMAVGVIGVTLAVLFQDPFDSGVGFSDDSQLIGYMLLALAVGIVIFQLITVRTQFPTN
jgi:hypothetical protein